MEVNIEVNNQTIKAHRGEPILEALRRNGITVPTLCHIKNFSPTGACRLCVVEIDGGRLVPSCSQPVEEWMKIQTHSPEVIKARQTIVELLLSSHPSDCLYCEMNGSCELQNLAIELNIRERNFSGNKPQLKYKKDITDKSIVRDPSKCILCSRCIRVCNEIIGMNAIEFIGRGSLMSIGTTFNKGLNSLSCIRCGQCIMVCPTGSLIEKTSIPQVQEALHNPDLVKVAYCSPTMAVSIGEEFGISSETDMLGITTALLRKIGFEKVIDGNFSVDVTMMAMAKEIRQRRENKEVMPIFSCKCPAWMLYVDRFRPDLKPNVSKIMSSSLLMGKIIKHYFSETLKVLPENIFVMAATPCVARKQLIYTEESFFKENPGTNVVITTREFARLIRLHSIDPHLIQPEKADSPFDTHSSAARITGASGGLAEAVARALYADITGDEFPETEIVSLRNENSFKETEVKIGDDIYRFAAVSGMGEVIRFLENSDYSKYDFIEITACPNGCINGGGQPISCDKKIVKKRRELLYQIDRKEKIRSPHKNEIAVKTMEILNKLMS